MSENTFILRFDILRAAVQQEIKILDPSYTIDAIQDGLNSGLLATSMWHGANAEKLIVDLNSGKKVAEIVSQEVDGEYVDFDLGIYEKAEHTPMRISPAAMEHHGIPKAPPSEEFINDETLTKNIRDAVSGESYKRAVRELSILYSREELRSDEALQCILQMMLVFSHYGLEGEHYHQATNLMQLLMRGELLCPLFGTDEEWEEIPGKNFYRNKRLPSVIKKNGKSYDVRGIVYVDKDGNPYLKDDSMIEIEFPYTREIKYISDEDPPAFNLPLHPARTDSGS